MSPTRSGYRELGLEQVQLEEGRPRQTTPPPMAEEKRDDRVGDPIKMLLEETLAQQRNEMMDNFTQILQRMLLAASASSTSSRFGNANPFKVQVKFYIHLFLGKIDADALDNWLNVLEGYFFVHNFSNGENITFVLLKAVPHVQNWWGTYWEQISSDESDFMDNQCPFHLTPP